ncbi:PEP-CTERM sorting domain-containing protein [Lentisalinibacter sediminis]|uniref:PEP-CTERM sorting domain-containing protein n=1 Tax=Lentisalinibacter sediminis TaxID=2992237 RepID=UPI00386F2C28
MLSLLFNGPEYGDVGEIAHVVATTSDGSQIFAHVFTAEDDEIAEWWVNGVNVGGVENLDPANSDSAAVWSIRNPFGGTGVTGFGFTATASDNCFNDSRCNKQSDFSLVSVSVPEPGTLALLGLGLLGIGLVRRRNT